MLFRTIPSDIDAVIREARQCVREFLLHECAIYIESTGDIEAGRRMLINYAKSNRSGWSGGPASGTNIHEALIRDVALELADYHDLNCLSFPHLNKPA